LKRPSLFKVGLILSIIGVVWTGFVFAEGEKISQSFHLNIAQTASFDMQSNPEDVVIEQRNASEVTGIGDKKTAPDGINVINPAFDMTPPDLITGIITEKGIVNPPFETSIKKLFEENSTS